MLARQIIGGKASIEELGTATESKVHASLTRKPEKCHARKNAKRLLLNNAAGDSGTRVA